MGSDYSQKKIAHSTIPMFVCMMQDPKIAYYIWCIVCCENDVLAQCIFIHFKSSYVTFHSIPDRHEKMVHAKFNSNMCQFRVCYYFWVIVYFYFV